VPTFWSRWCHATARVPDRSNERYAECLAQLLEERPTRVVMVGDDGTVDACVSQRELLDRGAVIALGRPEALAVAADKARLLAVAVSEGIAVPRSVEVSACRELKGALDEIGFPAVLKARQPWVGDKHISRHFPPSLIMSLEEAEQATTPIFELGGDVLVQEWVPGRREAVDLVFDGNQTHGEFAYIQERTIPAVGGVAALRESIAVPDDTLRAARQLVDAIGLEGFAEVEFRRDHAGRPVLMEINPRLTGSLELAVRAGVDFPLLIYRWALGESLDAPKEYQTGLKLRWLGHDIRWLRQSLSNHRQPDTVSPLQGVKTFLADFASPMAYDYVDWHDPMPVAAAVAGVFARAGRRWLARLRPSRSPNQPPK
jgi:predicted ATP-grasp superfamily ATP-dependent carboligase